MNYLQLVNAVLRRLREDTVTTVNESDYSVLIGDYVNDAKRLVEDAWDWSALRSTYSIDTVAEQALYPLEGFGVRSKILYIHHEDEEYELRQNSLEQIRRLNLNVDDNSGKIIYYALEGVDANGDAQLRLYRTPDAVYNLSVYTVLRPEDLINDTDKLLVPYNPVIQLAYAYALRERGETGGISSGEQAVYAGNYLNDAIALDANLRPEETIWTVS